MSNYYLPFILISLTHIIACVHGWPKTRAVTKTFVLPSLAMGYCLSVPSPIVTKMIALGFSFFGEIFFIDTDTEWRRISGLMCYFAGHSFYAVTMLRMLDGMSPGELPLCAALWLVILGLAVFICVRLLPIMHSKLRAIGVAYFCLLTVVACLAAVLLVQGRPGGLFLFAGSLVFILSDAMLCLENFSDLNGPDKFEITVMASYITAQFLLTLGLKL